MTAARWAAGAAPATEPGATDAATRDAVAREASEHGTGATPRTAERARIVVLGASGYAGHEFVRLALDHPALEIVALGGREAPADQASDGWLGLDPRGPARLARMAPGEIAALAERGGFDTLVSCLPHGMLGEWFGAHPALADSSRRIVDLSSDFRDESRGFRYGLPEAFRESLRGARRVANPGCYPTATLLALLPALERGWIDGPVTVSALSGASGAGRGAAARTSFVELDGGAAVYRAGGDHPHVAEMERVIARIGGARQVAFVPQLAPMARGILATVSAPLTGRLSGEILRSAYAERYAAERFVRVLDQGVWPETRAVRAGNRCDVAVTTTHGGRTLLAMSAIDNLVKGAAGQAIQNLNLMLGWPEDTGLSSHGSPW